MNDVSHKLPVLAVLMALCECRSVQAMQTIGDFAFQDARYGSEELAQISEVMEERKGWMT